MYSGKTLAPYILVSPRLQAEPTLLISTKCEIMPMMRDGLHIRRLCELLKGDTVPRFLDMHIVPPDQVTPEILAALHQHDLAVQVKYGVRYVKYWYDAATGRVFCLSDAPSREAALAVHREAHGQMPDDIFEVEEFE